MKFKLLSRRLTAFILSGLFTFGAGIFANDTEVFIIFKERIFRQLDASGPMATPDEHIFLGVVLASDSASVLSASITHPDQSLIQLIDEGDEWFFAREFAEASQLDASFPDGVYTFNITGANDGAKTIPLNLSGSFVDPVLVSNYSELQAIDPEQSVSIQWAMPDGASADDFILVYVEGCSEDDEFESPLPWESGALNGNATEFVIPAGRLNPGTVYYVDINYFRVVDQNPMDGEYYPGVYGIAAFATNLSFDIQTTGESDGLCRASLNIIVGTHGHMLVRDAETVSTNIHYPVHSFYSLSLNVRDPNPAAFEDVYFSGPEGSGITNVQALRGGGEISHYDGPTYDIPPLPLSGEYSVSYRGNGFSQFIDTNFLAANRVVAVPVFNLSDGMLSTLELSYHDAQSGAVVDITGVFDHAHLAFHLNSGGNVYHDFNPNSGVIDLSDLNLSWDSLVPNVYINLHTENVNVYTSLSIPDEHHTWNGYPIHGDGRAYTAGLMGWVYVFQQPWIYSYGLDNWVFTYPDYMRGDGVWVWVLSNPDTLMGPFSFWHSWPYFGGSTWVNTSKFLGKIDTRHDPIIWSEALNSWLFVPEEGFAAEGAWVFVYQMD